MVATVNNVSSAQQAGHYYSETDDYYSQGQEAPSRWRGKLAQEMFGGGAVDVEDFTQALSGNWPTGEQVGGENHRPATDITFSVDKSVSELMLRGGDEGIASDMWASAEIALAQLEQEAGARVKREGEVEFEQTGNLAAGMFLHTSSRNLDPQAHIHALILNSTRRADGKLVSFDNSTIYQRAKDLGQTFHNELAARLRARGYRVEKHILKSGLVTARIAGVPEELMEADSSRSKQIEENLVKMGLSRADCTRAQAEKATLEGRASKKEVDHEKLHARWREEGRELAGSAINKVRQEAEAHAEDAPDSEARAKAADEAVAVAAEHYVERDSRFTRRDLERWARGQAVGTGADSDDIRAAITRAEKRGDLLSRSVERYNPITRQREAVSAFTTPQAVKDEMKMLLAESGGRGQVKPIIAKPREAAERIEAHSRSSEHGFNDAQRSATQGALTSHDQIIGVEGRAGSAKTTSVMRTYAREAERAGFEVVGLAATASAADQLAEGAGIESQTVAKYLARIALETPEARKDQAGAEALANPNSQDVRTACVAVKPRVLLVDETSMLGAPAMSKLLGHARASGYRVVLTGNVRQRGSIERGEAFAQLQARGMTTFRLETAVRQRTDHAREAVDAVLARNASRALDALRKQPGGGLVEVPEDQRGQGAKERRGLIARDYLSLSPAQRSKTLVLDSTRAGRDALNRSIREGLQKEGTVARDEVKAESLTRKDMTQQTMRDVSRYAVGDRVIFARDRVKEGMVGGEVYTVAAVDQRRKELTLVSPGGSTQHMVRPELVGRGKLSVYTPQELPLAQGDQVTWTKNDRELGLKNGDAGVVLEARKDSARICFGERTVDVDLRKGVHLRHGYASTVDGAQGRTSDRVLAHAESFREGLLDNRNLYTTVSRARDEIKIYTENADGLRDAIEHRSGEREVALENDQERERSAERKQPQERERQVGDHGQELERGKKQERSRSRGIEFGI